MNNPVQAAIIVIAIAIGCAMQPVTGHDPSAGKLGGRNPLGAINEVLRSRNQRKLDASCFIRLTQTALTAHPDACPVLGQSAPGARWVLPDLRLT